MGSPAEKVSSHEMVGALGADAKYLAPEDAVSQSGSREQASRLVDDLELLRAERAVSREEEAQARQLSRSKSRHHAVPDDAFNEPAAATSVAPNLNQPPPSRLNRLWLKIKKFPRFIRYIVYMTPVAVILLTPVLLDIYAFRDSNAPVGGPGGVKLMWFGIWLETIWLSLWLARIVCAIMPPLFHFMANAAGSSNAKKWRDIGRQLELHTALFLWMLAVLCSYLPILNNTRDPSGDWNGGSPPGYLLDRPRQQDRHCRLRLGHAEHHREDTDPVDRDVVPRADLRLPHRAEQERGKDRRRPDHSYPRRRDVGVR